MSKIGLTSIIVLVTILCTGLHQTTAAEVAKSDKTEDSSKIRIPDKGFAIVLRAPMNENPQVVKISKNQKEDPVSGFTISLPKNTPTFFRVDQVNTVLYTVEITTEAKNLMKEKQDKPSGESPTRDTITKILDEVLKYWHIKPAVPKSSPEASAEETEKTTTAMENLKCKLLALKKSNSELDEHLYRSETSEFYKGNITDNFEAIKTKAKEVAKTRAEAEEAIKEVHKAYDQINKTPPPWVPKNLSDTSNEDKKKIINVFLQTTKKLQEIETAKWYKDDSQDRVLGEKIEYTCLMTPKPEHNKLKKKKLVVTVIETMELSGIHTTVGAFVTNLHDDTFANISDKIALGSQHRYSRDFGALAHLPLHSFNCRNFRGAVAISGGVASIASITAKSVSLDFGDAQPVLGGSLLLAGKTSNSLFAVTVGGIVKPVERLNGYSIGDTYPNDPKNLTMRVNRLSWFAAITFSYDILDKFSPKSNKTTNE